MIHYVKVLPGHGYLMKAEHFDKKIKEEHSWKEYDILGQGQRQRQIGLTNFKDYDTRIEWLDKLINEEKQRFEETIAKLRAKITELEAEALKKD